MYLILRILGDSLRHSPGLKRQRTQNTLKNTQAFFTLLLANVVLSHVAYLRIHTKNLSRFVRSILLYHLLQESHPASATQFLPTNWNCFPSTKTKWPSSTGSSSSITAAIVFETTPERCRDIIRQIERLK